MPLNCCAEKLLKYKNAKSKKYFARYQHLISYSVVSMRKMTLLYLCQQYFLGNLGIFQNRFSNEHQWVPTSALPLSLSSVNLLTSYWQKTDSC